MIKIENINTWGFESAIRGMRNPLNSWDMSDSDFTDDNCAIGINDLTLCKKLYRAGTEHRKYLRMVHIQMDVTCHSVWWAEFDTYKVSTVRNSCSKMHRIHIKSFEPSDFSHEGISEVGGECEQTFMIVLSELERLRILFNKTHEKKYWRAIIELLPSGYNMRATIDINYETAINILHQRRGHKIFEWDTFCDHLLMLPWLAEIIVS